MTVIFVSMIAVIAAIFIIFNMFIAQLLKPLDIMVQALKQISTDWDITRRLHLQRRDEIGLLVEFFNLTFERMSELLVGIKGKTVALFNTGDELSSSMSETRSDIDKISSNIKIMRQRILTQSEKVNTTYDTIDNIIRELTKLNDNIQSQSESVSQSSSAIEKMLASIQSVTQTLVKNSTNIDSLAKSSSAGRADLQKVVSDIKEIAKDSAGILEINSVMENIATQTNLLSMNAAIEAAHAGEAGRGFAVVAGEIRKLAENSSAQSKTISTVLKKIKTSIDVITASTAVALQRFENIEAEVKTVSDQETQIRNSMEEQSIGSQNILDAIKQLNSLTGLVQKLSQDMTAESQRVIGESKDLKRISGEVTANMEEMTLSVSQIGNIIVRAKEIVDENKDNIDSVSGEISRFKATA
jgi:methyl-accepting chemotaxis protein